MVTAENIFDNFKFTMSGLEKGLQVIHITTPAAQLLCCQHDEPVETILVRPDLSPFDQIPVKENETIIGLLKRRNCPDGAKGMAKDYMYPLGEKMLVSADTPLLEFIQNDPLDRIVIGGTKIYGLVTKSDFLKLPVSLLGFALVTHVEALMLTLIRTTDISENLWLSWLKDGRRSAIEKKVADLAKQRSDLDALELTYISDKIVILNKLTEIESYANYLPDKELIAQLKEIKDLRNTIAHTGNNVDVEEILQAFIDRLRMTHTWIEQIEEWQSKKAKQ